MKILAYTVREDEKDLFEKFAKEYKVDLTITSKAPTMETVSMSKGYDAVNILTNPLDKILLDALKENGVKFVATRTIGYEHIDVEYAKKIGIGVENITYSPNTVSEYTIMLILMANRKFKQISLKSSVQDFSLYKVRGRELKDLTVGVIGTGRIGKCVIGNLQGFGCKVLAYDKFENQEVAQMAKYTSFEELIKESDIICLHLPANKDSYHIIDEQAISKMKNDVIIVNTGRGSLIDSWALIDAVEQGKIAGAALDVVEDETDLYYRDLRLKTLNNRPLAILKSFPNVIVTPHTAFFTDQAVSDMIEHSIVKTIEYLNK